VGMKKILQTEVLYQGRLRAVRQHVETSDGKRYTHETIEHPGAVVILPVLSDGRIVCVSQYRHSLTQTILELPAGTLEAHEAPLDCARREIREEIGMAAREIKSLGILYPAPGFCNEVQHLFVAKDLYSDAATPDEDEEISLVSMTQREFEEAIVTGTLNDAKSIALFTRARLMGVL
jgi:ADP-ribose pyrophosphatase